MITPPAAKKIIERELIARSVPFTKLAAQTVHFTDLARTSRIFVKIHGWQPNPVWGELKRIAVAHGFHIETRGERFLRELRAT